MYDILGPDEWKEKVLRRLETAPVVDFPYYFIGVTKDRKHDLQVLNPLKIVRYPDALILLVPRPRISENMLGFDVGGIGTRSFRVGIDMQDGYKGHCGSIHHFICTGLSRLGNGWMTNDIHPDIFTEMPEEDLEEEIYDLLNGRTDNLILRRVEVERLASDLYVLSCESSFMFVEERNGRVRPIAGFDGYGQVVLTTDNARVRQELERRRLMHLLTK